MQKILRILLLRPENSARTRYLIGRPIGNFRRNLIQLDSAAESMRSQPTDTIPHSAGFRCMRISVSESTGACSQEHLIHRTQRRPGRSPACKNSLSARAESHGRSSHGCPPGLAGIHRAEGGPRRPCGGSRDVMGPGARFYRYFFEEWKSWPCARGRLDTETTRYR
jgi:hypothetical protein